MGAVIAANLLSEGERLDKFAGWLGTKLGQGWKVARRVASPYVGAGLERVGAGTSLVGKWAGRRTINLGQKLGKAIRDKSMDFGRKISDKGQDLRNRYSS